MVFLGLVEILSARSSFLRIIVLNISFSIYISFCITIIIIIIAITIEAVKYARNEASHLMAESDVNTDRKLTRAEISTAYEAWLDSVATDHGEILRDENLDELIQMRGIRDEL